MIIGTLKALETCPDPWTVFTTIYSTRRKNSWRIYVVRGEINEETAYIQARSSMARAVEVNGKACEAEGKAKVVWRKASILKTHENCEGSISSTQRTRNSKKPSRMPVRSWKHQLLLLCFAKLRKIVGVVHPTKFKQNLRVFWKRMNPQYCKTESRCRFGKKCSYAHRQVDERPSKRSEKNDDKSAVGNAEEAWVVL